jgi:MscS family membrane protein
MLLLAAKKSVAAYAAGKVIAAAPLREVTDALREAGDGTGDYLRALWPAQWSSWILGPVSLSQLIEALLLLVMALVARWIVVEALLWLGRTLRARKLVQLHHRTADLLFRTINYSFLLAGLYLSISVLELPGRPVDWGLMAWRGWITLLLCFSAFLAYRLAYALMRNLFRSWTSRDMGLLDHGSFPLLRDLLRIAMLILALILIVETWGYNATTLLAGVGIGGLAIAFAAQDTISNVFGSIIIYLDRPFKVGDWIRLGDVEGSVEEIGIRSTRVRTGDKMLVLVPNKRVATDNIVNINEMTSRRLKQTLHLDISNPPEQVEAALQLIRQVLQDEMHAKRGASGWEDPAELKDDFWFAHLTAVMPTHYELTFLAFTVSTDYLRFQELQERLLLRMLHGLARQGVILTQLQFPPVAVPVPRP